jgi:hypothetical protein
MIRHYDRVAMPSFPVFWPYDHADRSYNNLLSKQGSFPRMPQTSKYFKFLNLSASRSRFRIPRAVETERYPFSWKTNHHAIFCCTYKTGHYCARTLPITFAFAYSPSVLLFPSPSRSMANTSVPHPTSPSAPSINDDDSGYNSAMESAAMVTSSSLTRGVIKMDDGEIPELANFFKKTIVTEADRQAYHDLGWLSDNLHSFIPEVDVPTVDGSTILCFECQLAAGLGFPPNKFLSSVMSYLGCSSVHLNANVVSALSSFAMLCECWLGIPPDTSLFWYYYSPARYSKTIFGGIGLSLWRKCRDEYIKATFKSCWKRGSTEVDPG